MHLIYHLVAVQKAAEEAVLGSNPASGIWRCGGLKEVWWSQGGVVV